MAGQVAKQAKLPLAWETTDQRNRAVRAVMDQLASDSPKNDDELRQWYIDTGKRAVQYGRERQLFTIPADYRLDVVDTPEKAEYSSTQW